MGAPGRGALDARLREVREELEIDVCVANGENVADGIGITPRLAGKVSSFFEYDDPSGRLAQQAQGSQDLTGPYPNTTRFGAGAGLRYALNEWADLDLNVEWERRNGRISGFVNHRATLGATIYLNALKPKRQGGASPEM